MLEVTLYTRRNCHLCEEVQAHLDSLQSEYPHRVTSIDIDSDPQIQKIMGDKIPVVELGPYSLRAPITRQQLQMTLAAATDRLRHIAAAEESAQREREKYMLTMTGVDKFSYFMSRHYLAVFNLFMLIYVGLPFLAPVLMKAGLTAPANSIYNLYSGLCHQLAYRSWFLFGEQPVYPTRAAGVDGYLTYEDITGNDPDDLWTARSFIGDNIVGYKVAFCQRDVAIYAGIFLFGVFFALTGRKLKTLPWYLWIVLGILPIGLDGGTQLISRLPWEWLHQIFPYRESTPLLRNITGALFGITTAWFGYPAAEKTMRETRAFMEAKLNRIARAQQAQAAHPPTSDEHQ